MPQSIYGYGPGQTEGSGPVVEKRITVNSNLGLHRMHNLWQSELQHRITLNLIQVIKVTLENDCCPGKTFNVQLYGSLQQGLFAPGSSKVNIDVTPQDELSFSPDSSQSGMVLRMLASALQTSSEKGGLIQHPVLVWHRTAQRPWMVMMGWDGIPVYITYHNVAGVEVSQVMTRTLSEFPSLRLTLFHWKEQLRQCRDMQFLGPNNGQVSTYALFTVLCAHIQTLMASTDLKSFEERARLVAVAHLLMVPHHQQTADMMMLEHVNLTSRSYLAPGMARALATLSPITTR